MDMSFKTFLRLMTEDVNADVEKLRSDIAMIDAQIVQRTGPLQQKKAQLQKMLAVKQKQQDAELNRKPEQPTTASNSETKTSTPGTAGAETPGSGS